MVGAADAIVQWTIASAERQLQIDFGETRVPIGIERVRVDLFVATLGYSRRPCVQAFRHERQSAWLDGIEAALRHFGGGEADQANDPVDHSPAERGGAARQRPGAGDAA